VDMAVTMLSTTDGVVPKTQGMVVSFVFLCDKIGNGLSVAPHFIRPSFALDDDTGGERNTHVGSFRHRQPEGVWSSSRPLVQSAKECHQQSTGLSKCSSLRHFIVGHPVTQ
jgi:hypothetical protein